MTPDLTADMRPDDREALRDAFESGRLRRAFDEATRGGGMRFQHGDRVRQVSTGRLGTVLSIVNGPDALDMDDRVDVVEWDRPLRGEEYRPDPELRDVAAGLEKVTCRPRVTSCRYPWPDTPADYSWRCPLHGPRWVEPVKPSNNAIESWATLAEAVDDARRHVEEKR